MRVVLAAAALALTVLPVSAADYGSAPSSAAVAMPSSPGIPACDDPGVLSDILDRQHWAETNTWKDGVRIEAIENIRQTYAQTKFISDVEHRHCQARALLGPGRSDRLYYTISREMGFAGISWYVDFCMPRHDPWRVYDGDCRVLW